MLEEESTERRDGRFTSAPISALPSNGRARYPLRDAAVQVIKELIWRYVVRFEPRRTPLCIYGSRRSGSTLLMEAIGNNRRVMFSDQPFTAYTISRANLNHLPLFSYGQIICPDPEEERSLHTYCTRLLAGEIRANIPWKLGSPEFHFRNDRLCLKITDAKGMADWLDQHFAVHSIVLTRHPIAQSLSVMNTQWMTTGKGLLRNEGYAARWLNSDLKAFCEDIYRSGPRLHQHVTDWALENLPLVAYLKQHRHWMYLSFEDLITAPAVVVDCLVKAYDLTDRDRMLKRLSRPSRSTTGLSTRSHQRLIEHGDRRRLLSSWRDQVSASETAECFQILERLGIDLYSPTSDLPDHARLDRSGYGG